MAKKVSKQQTFVAAKMMESFIESGQYSHLMQTKKKIKLLTEAMKQRLESSEVKRHEFEKYQLVGRFIAKKVYETDIIKLNEYLFDLGLLLPVIEIDNKKIQENILYWDMIKDFQLEDTFYLKPNFNKVGKALNNISRNFEVTERWSLEDMARTLSLLKPQAKTYSNNYEKLKRQISKLDEIERIKRLPKEERFPIPHKYGSLSVLANQARYDVSAIYDYIGEWMLIEYGVPNHNLLEHYILNGTITKRELEQFKVLKDIRLDFSVMTLEDERKLYELLDSKNRIIAANRMGA
ncbi:MULTISPECIES: hypothetical protein [Bacillota]|uniref:hypothetical protein n=1 Tax=Bacillota TaxID=1239 RepID=UPI0039EED706